MIAARLLGATPLPPDTDDVDALLAAADAMMRAREEILRDACPEATGSEDLAELHHRDAAWAARITTARDAVGTARLNHARAQRHYR